MRGFFSRATSIFVVAACIGLASGACSDERDGPERDGSRADCGRFTTCGSCTPVPGCGWCATPGGRGACASEPNECAAAEQFSWTWEPSGCRAPADASVVGVDAGVATDAGADADGGPR